MWNAAIACVVAMLVAAQIRHGLPVEAATESARQAHLWLGYGAMSLIDALTIYVIRAGSKNIPLLTTPLTIILALSIINHALGGISYAAGNHFGIDIYDSIVTALGVIQIYIFLSWWIRRRGRRDRRFHPRVTGYNFSGRDGAPRNPLHKAGHR